MRAASPAFRFTAEPLGDAFDLLAAYRPGGVFFERGGRGVAGSLGVPSMTMGPPEPFGIVETLRGFATRHHDVAPVAMGAIAFEQGGGHHLDQIVIARRTVRRTDRGRTWRLDADEPGHEADDPQPFQPVAGAAPHEPFTELQLTPVPTPEVYRAAVAEAVERIGRAELRKVVLARTIEVDAGRPLDPKTLVHRLRAVDPAAYVFAAPTDDGVIVGASPELLVSRRGREVRSNPLAGSAPRSGDPEEDRASAEALAASTKDQEEHVIVVEAVAEILAPFCEELTWDPEPVLRETPNVWHLSTSFQGILRDPAPTAVDLVAALHPTPAIAGTPTDAALAVIEELEPFDRGRYAGPVGWVDANGDGEWAIALRCAELRGDRAILFAGAGIVAGSDPSLELDETERKFRAFLDALRWG